MMSRSALSHTHRINTPNVRAQFHQVSDAVLETGQPEHMELWIYQKAKPSVFARIEDSTLRRNEFLPETFEPKSQKAIDFLHTVIENVACELEEAGIESFDYEMLLDISNQLIAEYFNWSPENALAAYEMQ